MGFSRNTLQLFSGAPFSFSKGTLYKIVLRAAILLYKAV